MSGAVDRSCITVNGARGLQVGDSITITGSSLKGRYTVTDNGLVRPEGNRKQRRAALSTKKRAGWGPIVGADVK